MGKQWKQWQTFIFLGSADYCDDCSQEIKRCLLLGRKAMTNLDSMLKSRDITLPTKVCIVKALVFPVVVYGCELDPKEGWAPKNWYFWTTVLENTLEGPSDSKEIKLVNSKGNQLWIFIGRSGAEAEAPILWPHDVKSWLTGKDCDAGKDWGQEEKEVIEDEMVGWHHWLNGHEFEQTLGDSEGHGAWHAAVHEVAKSWIRLSTWTMWIWAPKGYEPWMFNLLERVRLFYLVAN